MEEIWKDIEGYEGKYMVSSLGRVRSVRKDVILTPNTNNSGYMMVHLKNDGQRKCKRIHRLVAESFIPNPDNKPYVDHINGIQTDNCANNLRWCTCKENLNFPLAKANRSGKTVSDETKTKMRIAHLGKKRGPYKKHHL